MQSLREKHREIFENLLTSPNYERLRFGLIRVFARRGCDIPEDLADETIARVVQKLDELQHYHGNPVRYFYGVARNVLLEHRRRPRMPSLEDVGTADASLTQSVRDDSALECLEECMARLDEGETRLISEYYRYDKVAKVRHRKHLAEELGGGLNALRLRAHRIRQRLTRCVESCLKKNRAPAEMKSRDPA